jgi:hypothetical protein
VGWLLLVLTVVAELLSYVDLLGAALEYAHDTLEGVEIALEVQ